jgi:mannose-1-phosphate guanylyltransferase
MLTAAKVAYEGKYLIAVGIKPTFAHPGLGYIQFGKHIKEVNGLPLRYVASFKEKPDIPTAEQYLAQGDYLWNANNYTWGASTLLEAFEVHDPGHAANIKAIQAAIGTPQLEAVMAEQYEHAEKTPIDTAISEKAENLLVLPGMYSWDDIGGWQVVYDLAEKDADGNSHIQNKDAKTPVPIIEQDSKNNLIYYSNQPIAVLGLSDVVVVDTGSGLLVANRHQANDVKKIVEKLKSDGNEQYV